MDMTRHGGFAYAYRDEDDPSNGPSFMMGKVKPALETPTATLETEV